jgi:hypothetical protein
MDSQPTLDMPVANSCAPSDESVRLGGVSLPRIGSSQPDQPWLLGNYRIIAKLGEGGMGLVFKAQDLRSEQVVALKMLQPDARYELLVRQRFQREVSLARRLRHPHIVTALDAGEDRGILFLVMEYISGKDLGRLLAELGPRPAAQAVDWVVQAARGLEHAHAAGVIHRDIKPSNLLLDAGGTIKVLDLGCARLENSANATTGSTTSLTQSGALLGTCDYIAPEQALNSKHAGPAADIYSLGCTLHFLLTGQPLYGGQSTMEKLLAHREQAIPLLAAARPDVPAQLDAIFQCMVAKKVEDRFQCMSEVIAALEDCRRALIADSDAATAPATLVQPRRPRDNARFPSWRKLTLAMVLLAGLVTGGALLCEPRLREIATATPATDAADEPRHGEAPVRDERFEYQVGRLPPERQFDEVVRELRRLNGRFPRTIDKKIEDGVVTELSFSGDRVSNLAPLAALKGLRRLSCNATSRKHAPLTNLAPLAGLPLTHLEFANAPVVNLAPLAAMRLTVISCAGTRVDDLGPLHGMPLVSVRCERTVVHSLVPLAGAPLREIWADPKLVRDSANLLRAIATLEQVNGKVTPEFRGMLKEQ